MKLTFATWNINGGADAGDTARLHRQMAPLAGLGLPAAVIRECKYRDKGNARTSRKMTAGRRLLSAGACQGRAQPRGSCPPPGHQEP
jgi:hypothetical protein